MFVPPSNSPTVPLDLSFYAQKALELVWTSNSLSLATDKKWRKLHLAMIFPPSL
jgi:hypothetical protein